ncbi:hypothetical protein D3C85_1838650 [compost metagenome]
MQQQMHSRAVDGVAVIVGLGATAAHQFRQIVGIFAGANRVTEDSPRGTEQCEAQQVGQGFLQFALQVQ